MLIEYLPPVVGKIREMKEICAAEQPEFDLLAQQVDQILANMFILLANEEGIKRFEEELNITPKTSPAFILQNGGRNNGKLCKQGN